MQQQTMNRWKLWLGLAVLAALIVSFGLFLSHEQTNNSLLGSPAQAAEPTDNDGPNLKLASQTFVSLAKRLSPSVVNIEVKQVVKQGSPEGLENIPKEWRNFFGPYGFPDRDRIRRGQGSGFIIDHQGYVVTNNHVVDNAEKIKVKLLDGREFDAKIVGADPETDVALIKIENPKNLSPIELGDSEKLQVGEWVLAIGNPFGLSHTVTAGIVSAKGRQTGAMTADGPAPDYQNFIQTDASINPGNSGGPLIDINGRVVGINSMIAGIGTGIGFAIPINLARDIFTQLKDEGEVTRGWLGVGIQDLTPDLATGLGREGQEGVLVNSVFADSPAAKAGMKVEDIIVTVDGQRVKTAKDLMFIIASKPVDYKVKIGLVRNGTDKQLTVKLGKRGNREELAKLRGGPLQEDDAIADSLGMRLQNITPELAERLGLDEATGVLVASIEPGGPAGDAGIGRGDVLLEVNRTPITGVQKYNEIVKGIKAGGTLMFYVNRNGNTFYLTLLK